MRQIKFRVWFAGMMWQHDQISHIEFDDNGIRRIHLNHEHGDHCTVSDTWTDSKKEDCVLMQFTGLHDKNGVEIYEGDILKTDYLNNEPYENVLIEWRDSGFMVDCETDEDFTTLKLAIDEGWKFEVIGNLHQNPDLLK